jgi:hypothetical protein
MAPEPDSIAGIAVRGFKSICEEQRIEIRPLTLLAGANSSGKSSIMQPLLLLKQTIEAPGDPGALLLDGPNVRFTSAEQLLCKGANPLSSEPLAVRLENAGGATLETRFKVQKGQGFEVVHMVYRHGKEAIDIVPDMDQQAILAVLPEHVKQITKELTKHRNLPTQGSHYLASPGQRRHRLPRLSANLAESKPDQGDAPQGHPDCGGTPPRLSGQGTLHDFSSTSEVVPWAGPVRRRAGRVP